jgi:hypothetical protein
MLAPVLEGALVDAAVLVLLRDDRFRLRRRARRIQRHRAEKDRCSELAHLDPRFSFFALFPPMPGKPNEAPDPPQRFSPAPAFPRAMFC